MDNVGSTIVVRKPVRAPRTGGNLARNVVMTVAAIVTMAVSLTALGGVLIMRQAINQATVQYQGGVELVAFMNANASAQEIAGLRQQLAAMVPEEVRSCHFVDKAQAYAEFKSMFSRPARHVEGDDGRKNASLVPLRPG